MTEDGEKAPLSGSLSPDYAVHSAAEDFIRRAIDQYGAEEVKAAVKNLTKRRPGNPGIDPLPDLLPLLQQDADEWLAGGDPFTTRKDNAIATAYAEKKGAREFEANKKREERYLRAERKNSLGRRFWVFFLAWHDSKTGEYPHVVHLRAIEALRDLEPDVPWQWYLDRAARHIRDYTARNGAPAECVTMREIMDGARSP